MDSSTFKPGDLVVIRAHMPAWNGCKGVYIRRDPDYHVVRMITRPPEWEDTDLSEVFWNTEHLRKADGLLDI